MYEVRVRLLLLGLLDLCVVTGAKKATGQTDIHAPLSPTHIVLSPLSLNPHS